MIASQAATVSATLALAAFQIVQSAESGSSVDQLAGQATIVGTGVAVFLYQERRRRSEQAAWNKARRESDKAKDARIRELEQRVDRLVDRITPHPEEGHR